MRAMKAVLACGAMPLAMACATRPAAPAAPAPTEREALPAPAFTYGDQAAWGGDCGVTTNPQSPIDVRTDDVQAAGAPLTFSYPATATIAGDVEDDTYTIQARYEDAVAPAERPSFVGPAGQFVLQRVHVHFPSEHTVDGRAHAGEMHMVHKSADGHFAVVAYFIDAGPTANPLFDRLLAADPGTNLKAPAEVALPMAWVPAETTRYWTYTGSLTTPPCTTGITWIVMKDPVLASEAQLATWTARFEGTNRHTMPVLAAVTSPE